MRGMVKVAARSVILAALACGAAGGAELLVGVESDQFELDLVHVNDPTDQSEWTGHHSSTSALVEWSASRNLRLRLKVGTLSTSLEEYDTTAAPPDLSSSGMDGGLLLSAGLILETELETGGELILDVSYTKGDVEWEDGGNTEELNFEKTEALVGYVFGRGERTRPYVGVAYGSYSLDELQDGTLQESFEEDQKLSVVAGVRARTSTFVGYAEARALGEFGVRVGIAFGF